MRAIFQKTWLILTPRERAQALGVTALMVVLALIEVTGIVSIAPFLTVLGNPDAMNTNAHLGAVYRALDFHDARSFMAALGMLGRQPARLTG